MATLSFTHLPPRFVHLQKHSFTETMPTSSLTLHILLLLASLLSPPSHSSVLPLRSSDTIDQICKQTPFFDLCSATLHSSPLNPKSDLKCIALAMLNDILKNTTDTLGEIEALIKKTSDRQLEQSLAYCAESYIPIVKYTLPQAADAVSQGRFGFASYCVADAEKEVVNCQKRLAASNLPSSSPLGDRNGVVQKLVGVASAIIRLLLKG